MTHIAEAQLHDYIDDEIAGAERHALDRHLQQCVSCAAKVRGLRELQASLRALPRSIAPDTDLLPGIHQRTRAPRGASDSLRLHVIGAPAARTRRARWPLLAAAAIVLCALSSAITIVIVRGMREMPAMASSAMPVGPAQLVELRATELRYQDAIEELRAALLNDQGMLGDQTVQLLEQSLTTIDRALAEAHAALAADPANAVLAEMLHANYEKKLDLLRRASAHARVSL